MDHARLLEQFFANNIRGLAKILTVVESRQAGFETLMGEIVSKGQKNTSYRLGLTGPPGAGKSTIVDGITHLLRREKKRVGIVAIDPSSPFTGGAVLGDRIRMQDHAGDSGVYIRSLGSRGSHGGLSRATRDIVRVMSAFGFDYIIVETVGVGQTELDIMELADTTAVILVPEAGDTIQTMKAGLLEIADIFVVNKCDRPGADQIMRGLAGLVEMNGKSKWKIPIVKTTATKSEGIKELLDTINNHRKFAESDDKRKLRQEEIKKAELIQITLELFEIELRKHIASGKNISTKENPYTAARKTLNKIIKEN